MKTALLSLALLLAATAFAQIEIPNPSFEGWNMDNTWNPTPDDWITQNWQLLQTTYMDSSPCHDSLAMLVRPIQGFETAAGVSYVEIDTDYIPSDFSFCVKRYIDIAQDTVQVRLRFWNSGGEIPFVVYENTWATSETDTTWNYVNMPLEQIEPVMHYVSIEVIAGYNGPLGGGSHLTWISVDDMKFDMVNEVPISDKDDFDLLVANNSVRLQPVDAFQKQPIIQLFDIRGKLVAQTRENVLNFDHLRSGIYIAALLIDGQTVSTKRAFKQ